MKSHEILKRLASLAACLSAIGTPGSAFAKVTKETGPNATQTVPIEKPKINASRLKQEPPENRIGDKMLKRLETSIRRARVDWDVGRDRMCIVVPGRTPTATLLIDAQGVKTKKDLNEKVYKTILKRELTKYLKYLKHTVNLDDNAFRDLQFLDEKVTGSKIKDKIEMLVTTRGSVGEKYALMEKALAEDELDLFVGKIIKENRLLDVELPPDFYSLIPRNSRNARNLPDNSDMEEFYE